VRNANVTLVAARQLRIGGLGFAPPNTNGTRTLALVTDQLSAAISHATASAFMLGAVAAYLSILISRLERVVERNRAIRTADVDIDPSGL
jgi:hypothetical protein